MSKSVMRSCKPYWLYLIIQGVKIIEVGKTAPTAIDWNQTVYMYCSKDKKSLNRIPAEDREWFSPFLGKVIGEFVCDKIEDFSQWQYDYGALLRHIDLYAGTNCDYMFLNDYLKGKKSGYAWHITDLKIYDEPKELSEFDYYNKCVSNCENVDCCKTNAIANECEGYTPCAFTRPPQSWCYCEELEENENDR